MAERKRPGRHALLATQFTRPPPVTLRRGFLNPSFRATGLGIDRRSTPRLATFTAYAFGLSLCRFARFRLRSRRFTTRAGIRRFAVRLIRLDLGNRARAADRNFDERLPLATLFVAAFAFCFDFVGAFSLAVDLALAFLLVAAFGAFW